MIQILGLRPNAAKTRQTEVFFEKNWRAGSVAKLFAFLEKYLEKIPEDMHYNLFYTVAECLEESGRKLKVQTVIPYDIDGIDHTRIDEYHKPILEAIGSLSFNEVGVIGSGNGLQYLVDTDNKITDDKYFDETREYYKIIAERINGNLSQKNLPGHADASVWSAARLMRLPETMNIKTPEQGCPKKNTTKKAILIQRVIKVQKGYDIKKVAGNLDGPDGDILTKDAIKHYPLPDTDFVISSCDFIQYVKYNANEVSEEDWYKMLSVVSHLENGRELCHSISEGYKNYDRQETEDKIDQALDRSGPRTCHNIEKTFEKCRNCAFYRKVKSPILLHGPDYIKTKGTGFRSIVVTDTGTKAGPVNHDDLLKHFKKKHEYFSLSPSGIPYIWDTKNWKPTDKLYLYNFCEKNVVPAPKKNDREEFRSKITCDTVKLPEFLTDSIHRKINLQNGVLDLNTKTLCKHSPEYGFTSALPYSYDKDAECPRFDQFMKEITCNRQSLIDVLLEFAGYAFSNEKCIHAKALILLGEGRNGKSTFMKVLKALASPDLVASVPIAKLEDPQYSALLHGKAFNLSEETPTKAFADSSTFKNIISGGDICVKVVYQAPFFAPNMAKLIFACNELPRSFGDVTLGMLRRMLIVPFDACFSGKREDKDIDDKLESELPGILNRVMEAYDRLKKTGNFTDCSVVDGELDEFRHDNDPIYNFKEECLSITEGFKKDKNNSTDVYTIYSEYDLYCKRNGIRFIAPKNTLMRGLKRHIDDLSERKFRGGEGNKTRYYGIKIADNNKY
jgi:P4 family phage/plasmid primase-like protien